MLRVAAVLLIFFNPTGVHVFPASKTPGTTSEQVGSRYQGDEVMADFSTVLLRDLSTQATEEAVDDVTTQSSSLYSFRRTQ